MRKSVLVAYDANNVFRNRGELGQYGRELISKMASRHASNYRALLFCTRIKSAFRRFFTSDANVSTISPNGWGRVFPSLWLRSKMGLFLRLEKVQLFHGLNDELPPDIRFDVRTVVTCFGLEGHHATSLGDRIAWRRRMQYALQTADVVVAVSEQVRRDIIATGINEAKVVVIGNGTDVTDTMVEQYYTLYETLVKPAE